MSKHRQTLQPVILSKQSTTLHMISMIHHNIISLQTIYNPSYSFNCVIIISFLLMSTNKMSYQLLATRVDQ